MRKYWWVNHKQTSHHEIAEGFLWSPKTKKNGVQNQFYKNMRVAIPGDFVLSFSSAKIAYVGQVSDYALTTQKPEIFGKAGAEWADEGWLLPVVWRKLDLPVRPKDFIDELAPHLPKKYSPIQAKTGNGNEVAYLAEIDLAVFQAVLSKAGVDLDLAFSEPELTAIFGDYAEQLDEAIERQLSISPALSSTEKSQLVMARRGQGVFRANVRQLERSCRLTGVENPYLLIASHIKPWRVCHDSLERLDGNNGLLLTPHVDLLFDKGLISFANNGTLMVSPKMTSDDMHRLGLITNSAPPRQFNTRQCGYLDYHRSNVFVYPE
jgi:putative restriction endonuclease